jgi:3-methyladenine DNA glycosylase AlkD
MLSSVLAELDALADPARLAGMARVGIATDGALGVSIPDLRRLARRHRGDHALALALWDTGTHEARLLAGMVDDPAQVTPAQLERWVVAIDSWDVGDQLCNNLIHRTPHAWDVALAWAGREEGYVKRAGFALFAVLAVHDGTAADERFTALLPLIEREAGDARNEVRKAVNWALRQIGKRNDVLRVEAIACGERIHAGGDRSARWVATDALRELRRG